MLEPRRQKYRKQFRGKRRGMSGRGHEVSFGEFALKAQSVGWIKATQLEAARRVIAHVTRRGGKIWIRVFPDKPFTHKAEGTRMGGGKGEVVGFVAVVRPGRIIFELAGVPEDIATQALSEAASKLPIKAVVIKRR